MPQSIVYLDSNEDRKVKTFSNKWNISKAETIKRIIIEFKEKEVEVNNAITE